MFNAERLYKSRIIGAHFQTKIKDVEKNDKWSQSSEIAFRDAVLAVVISAVDVYFLNGDSHLMTVNIAVVV